MEHLFLNILNMSMTASYVILFVLLVRMLLRKSPKLFSYILWSVVLFRLTCPVSFSSVISFLKPVTPSTGKLEYIPHDIGLMQQPIIDTGIGNANNAINSSLPPAVDGASANPMQVILFVLAIIWVEVMLVLIGYSIISYIMLKKRVSTAVRIKDNIYTVENIPTAFVLGLMKPRIYLPIGLTEPEQSYILRHEQTHIRRFDYIIKPIAFLVLCVHWFNPLVWLSFILMSRDMEMSCDERVIAQLGSGIKKDYSTSLLSLSTGRRLISASPLAFGESNVKSRIKNVLNYRRPAFWVIIITAVLLSVAGVGLCANPDGQQEPDKQSTNGSTVSGEKIIIREEGGKSNLTENELVEWVGRVYNGYEILATKQSIELSPTYRIQFFKSNAEIWLYEDAPTIAASVIDGKATYISIKESDYLDMKNKIMSKNYNSDEKEVGEPSSLENDKFIDWIETDKTSTKSSDQTPAVSESLTDKIEKNLEIIMSSPKESSNPGDYIKAHKKEYDEIVAMGDEVLPYLNALWDSKHDLKGNLALAICKDIYPEIDVVSSYSPNGKLRLETYGIDTKSKVGDIYPAEGIRLVLRESGEILFKASQRQYFTDFLWSPDGKYVAINYIGETKTGPMILDIKRQSTVIVPDTYKALLSSKMGEPSVAAKSWVNNSLVKIEFKWAGKNNKSAIQGTFLYDVVNNRIASGGGENQIK